MTISDGDHPLIFNGTTAVTLTDERNHPIARFCSVCGQEVAQDVAMFCYGVDVQTRLCRPCHRLGAKPMRK